MMRLINKSRIKKKEIKDKEIACDEFNSKKNNQEGAYYVAL